MALSDRLIEDPRYKALAPEDQRDALSRAIDEDLKTLPDYASLDPARLSQAKEEYLNEQLVPDRGFFGDVASRFSRGVVSGIGATGAGLSTAIGSEYGEDLYLGSREMLKETPFLQPDKGERRGEEGYVRRSLMQAVESVPQSIGPLVAGVGAGLLAGPVVGTAVGAGAVINAFGLGQARKSTDEARDWLTQNRTDLSLDEIESMASRKGIEDGLFEAVPELLGDAIVVLSGGAGLALKQPITTTLKTLLRPQNFAKKFLINAAGEYSTELVTSIGQKHAAEKVGMPAPDLWEAVKEPFLTSVFMSVGMGGTVDIYSQVQTSRVLRGINAQDQEGNFDKGKRVETASEVIQKIEDPEVKSAWAEIAAKKIEDNEEIDINLPLVEFGAQKAAEEKGTVGLGDRIKKSLEEGQTTPEEIRAAMPGLQAEGIPLDQIESMLAEFEGAALQQRILSAESGDEARRAAMASIGLPAPEEQLALPPGQGFEAPGLAPSTRGEEAPEWARGHTPVVEMGPGPVVPFEPPPEWTRGHRPALAADQAPVAAPLAAPPVQAEDPVYQQAFNQATDRGAPEDLAHEYAQEALVLEKRAIAAGIPRSMREETSAAEMEAFLGKADISKPEVAPTQKSAVAAFTEGMTPLRANVEKTLLERKIKYEGETRSRRDLIEAGVAEGATVVKIDGKRRLKSPDGSVLTEKQTTKPGMDYAEFLIKESTDAQVQEAQVEQAEAEASQKAGVLAAQKPGAAEAVTKEVEAVVEPVADVPETDFGDIPKVEEVQEAGKQPWEMSLERYAFKRGAEKPSAGFDPSVSGTQIAFMSERAKADRLKGRIAEKKQIREKYKIVEKEWKSAVWDSYKAGKFKAKDVYDTESFYVLSEHIGKDIKSPFRISQMETGKREQYLSSIDAKIQTAPDISTITVRRPGIEEATGDDIEVEENAQEALKYVDNQLTALDKLRNCLGK